MGRELKRVPLDFNWPLNKVWEGFINPFWKLHIKCTACDGGGDSPQGKLLANRWYGYDDSFVPKKPFLPNHPIILARAKQNAEGMKRSGYVISPNYEEYEALRLTQLFNDRWMHHLDQADVDALVADGRLMDFTHTWTQGVGWKPKEPAYKPTAQEVNEWSLVGMGHDSINQWVCVKAKCEREGYPIYCDNCKGEGKFWPEGVEEKYDNWVEEQPPKGEGYQIWETVSEGSPISPVFANPEDLARWMIANDTSITNGTTFEQWMVFIMGNGWAPSTLIVDGKVMNGVEGLSQV